MHISLLVVSLVLTHLNYGNSVLSSLPVYLVRRLQSVLNAAARLICHPRRTDHISDALPCLRWLRVPERVPRSPCSHIKSSTYLRRDTSALSDLLLTYPVVNCCVPIAWYCLSANSWLSVAELFRSLVHRPGITSRKTWHQQNHWPHFVVSSRHTCSGSLFLTICWTST